MLNLAACQGSAGKQPDVGTEVDARPWPTRLILTMTSTLPGADMTGSTEPFDPALLDIADVNRTMAKLF